MDITTHQPLLRNSTEMIKKITRFWDQTSESWYKIWGPHIHHGYYDETGFPSFQQAQEQLLKNLSGLLSINTGDKILDVGCGLGGSSIYLAKKYHANLTGITLSAKQLNLAINHAKDSKIENIQFIIDDAHELKNFSHHYFDIVWSLESCEQFYNKKLFIQQAHRVLRPGGQLMLATWCAGDEKYSGPQAKLYKTLCQTYDLPYMPTIKWYEQLLIQENFSLKKVFDWSTNVQKSWEIGPTLSNCYSFLNLIKMAGWRGFLALKKARLMLYAYQQNLLKYGVFVATKSAMID